MDHDFQYALHAPDPAQRGELAEYAPAAADLEFARKFIEWNDLDHGIQRVDACRTREGDLLLVELGGPQPAPAAGPRRRADQNGVLEGDERVDPAITQVNKINPRSGLVVPIVN
ncbi:hypothetical protein [Lentzea sp. NPDC004782]|uniref:hypothetical protein n=1 Tax=Lentzea sp. NPDC004782 TaxID=3154458 RepID=UPI0033AAE876